MCNGKAAKKSHPILLSSAKACGASAPPVSSTLMTASIMIVFLTTMEQITRAILFRIKDTHQILESDINRYILARHLGVDSLSCFICAYFGWRHRQLVVKILKALRGDPNAMPLSTAESRGFAYQPAPFFFSVFFLSYQIKNLCDTIVWNDGPEYIFHHVLTLAVCWGAMYPSYSMEYAYFFFGLSEVSTGVLCILANFDDAHGVVGLAEAFPLTKVVVGVIFVVLFIICRCILWPIVSYYWVRDARQCLKSKSPLLEGRRFVIKMHGFCLIGLSALQLSWLVLIYFIAVKEFKAIGLL